MQNSDIFNVENWRNTEKDDYFKKQTKTAPCGNLWLYILLDLFFFLACACTT